MLGREIIDIFKNYIDFIDELCGQVPNVSYNRDILIETTRIERIMAAASNADLLLASFWSICNTMYKSNQESLPQYGLKKMNSVCVGGDLEWKKLLDIAESRGLCRM